MAPYLTFFCAFFLLISTLHSADSPDLEKDPLLSLVTHYTQDPEITVHALRVVDPETFKEEVFFTTRVKNLKTDCEANKKLNFSITTKQERKEDIKDISHQFRSHLVDKGWIASGDAQVILNREKLTIGGVEQSTKKQRELLKYFRESLGDFLEISLNVF